MDANEKLKEDLQKAEENLKYHKEGKEFYKIGSLTGLASLAYLGIRAGINYAFSTEIPEGDVSVLLAGMLAYGGFISSIAGLVNIFETKDAKGKVNEVKSKLEESLVS